MKKPKTSCRFLYIFALVTGLLLAAPPIAAQVNTDELGDLGPVEFINYVGPHTRIDTRAEIRAIGYALGQGVKNGAGRTGALGRYFIISSASPPDGTKLDADIMGLGADVGVNHIRNLRFIIQGYLEAAYEYNERDAALLAEYITIYNAVYRGDWTFFGARYKNAVMDNLSREKAGLALRYDEWPGQTLLLIPLGTGLGGPLSSVDTSSVSDPRVIEQLRQEPDMGLDQRKDMVDLREREADRAAQEAAISREAIRQEEQRIAQERERIQQQQQQARQEEQRIAQERQRQQQQQQQQQGTQQAGAEQQAIDQRQQALEQQQEALRQQEQELAQRQEELGALREQAGKQEEFAEQRTTETQQERQQIAEDQQSLINRTPPVAPAGGVLGISIANTDSALGRLVLLDNRGLVTRQSPLNTVNARTITVVNNRIFAIAGENRGGGAVRLVEMNASTLEMQKQGENDIEVGSLLWVNGQDLYAIARINGNLNLAKFNTDLVLQNRSSINVHPFASVLFHEGFLITQRSDGTAALLDPNDLSERK